MPIEVELPDGSIVEFPDGTKPKTMEMALAKYRQKPKALVMPDGSSAVDAGKRLRDDVKFEMDNDPTRGNSFA